MDYRPDSTHELTAQRKAAIDQYIAQQEPFTKLNAKNILASFKIDYLEETKEEIDIDACSEEQCNKLDSFDNLDGTPMSEKKRAKKKQEKEEFIATLPKRTDEKWSTAWILAPYLIGNSVLQQELSLDQMTTEDIEFINERTKIKIDTYQTYLDNQ